jgi:hypothetical protein
LGLRYVSWSTEKVDEALRWTSPLGLSRIEEEEKTWAAVL